jgi:hypothetical protein
MKRRHEELRCEGRRRPAGGSRSGWWPRNAERDFRGKKRKNDPHCSTTEPLHGQVGWLLALEDAIHITSSAPE